MKYVTAYITNYISPVGALTAYGREGKLRLATCSRYSQTIVKWSQHSRLNACYCFSEATLFVPSDRKYPVTVNTPPHLSEFCHSYNKDFDMTKKKA